MLVMTDRWTEQYPEAHIGMLVLRNVVNPAHNPQLDEVKTRIEHTLRSQFAQGGKTHIRSLSVMLAYKDYYKQFKKTYHVLQQVESVALKNRAIPSVAALVEAMFMAELKNMLLTAGHDLDMLVSPISINVSDGSETYTRINGEEQGLKTGDMYITDQYGVMSSIIYGPDQRTQITAATTNVMYTV
ncbi:MAG: hypothetical protein P1S60_16020, partial [Anaerolineae bacterium]|nr:hypothetical protein [Anaerolineae bacterium]